MLKTRSEGQSRFHRAYWAASVDQILQRAKDKNGPGPQTLSLSRKPLSTPQAMTSPQLFAPSNASETRAFPDRAPASSDFAPELEQNLPGLRSRLRPKSREKLQPCRSRGKTWSKLLHSRTKQLPDAAICCNHRARRATVRAFSGNGRQVEMPGANAPRFVTGPSPAPGQRPRDSPTIGNSTTTRSRRASIGVTISVKLAGATTSSQPFGSRVAFAWGV